ncbi:16S rRNA (cytosine(1402)-N(4))-methyltransferase RsmH [Leekyejoonella antrihumi]|uniref:Ribosomal RNA small subunit methyltransferase H n=1 Tax=Leekyejoonella antrihumi TaxID=1660198 RepID=A0A563DYW4_9MICO|nr:16S rRNA (cytosine(1402)-N(4))-methyltransferase RsmH [Leekyejoonella antrihumi]TWP35191.1 16S rRNA (cytosine(1402)-N(4))-methyltransferase RsmH [Leekyejoonella antrihumi]
MSSSRGSAELRHTPVLRERIVELLAPALERPGAVFVDGTLGMGGHTEAILNRCPEATAYGVDRDGEALTLAGERLGGYADRFRPVHAVYDEAFDRLDEQGVHEVDAVLFDLGVSSLQLDEADRGFAYSKDAPLDMRMDQGSGRTAADVLNTYPVAELERILREYGEERFARRIARAVVREREETPWSTSGRLVELLRDCIPAASQRSSGHPAKRTFQALRIEVNGELDSWRAALPRAIDHLCVGGRVAVLSYHSLEDRIAKRVLAAGATSSAPPGLPVELPEQAPYLKLLVRGGQAPTAQETLDNPRAASARLRAATRVRSTKGSTS